MRFLFEIAYAGHAYNGWQRQKNTHNTIQEHIEACLSRLLRRETRVVSCGRTDKGVHAFSFYFHLDADLQEPVQLLYKLNRMTDSHISIKSICEVGQDFHARFSATERGYIYKFHLGKNPFLHQLSLELDTRPDFTLMRDALDSLTHYRDFSRFCKTPEKHDSTDCKIRQAQLAVVDTSHFEIHVQANRFLKSMIRIVCHDILEVGYGRMKMESYESMLKGGNRHGQVQLLPPDGLYLEYVTYPNL